jgi:hypothetical protein
MSEYLMRSLNLAKMSSRLNVNSPLLGGLGGVINVVNVIAGVGFKIG